MPTNDDIESLKEFCGKSHLPILDELLSLRAIRDASGEEVSDLRTVICSGIWSNTKQKQEAADVAVDSIVSKVFFLREQLREAREENNRYHDEAQVADSLVLTLQKEVKMLTKERNEAMGIAGYFRELAKDLKETNRRDEAEMDEARSQLKKQIDITYEAKSVISRMQKDKHDNDGYANQRFSDDYENIKALKAELAELRKAPGMEEVDACITAPATVYYGDRRVSGGQKLDGKKLADIARRAIISREVEKKRADEWQEKCEDENLKRLIVEKERDEVVVLLKWLWTHGQCLYPTHPNNKLIKKLFSEIVEGK